MLRFGDGRVGDQVKARKEVLQVGQPLKVLGSRVGDLGVTEVDLNNFAMFSPLAPGPQFLQRGAGIGFGDQDESELVLRPVSKPFPCRAS